MIAQVRIRYRPGVLDPEARAIARALASLGYRDVRSVARAKIIELELATSDRAEAERQVREMCDRLLANPVIETYEVSLGD
ncbi:Phosphoribosylformylglycinamidine synthase subunit PurS [bacterium HR40]|nr:Phosphoribosylformylglycinamidine synthase subunit PurS [bacterium HR40]